MSVSIRPAEGKLGVLLPGLGAVATTFIAGVEAVKAGLGQPVGSLTQMGTIRLGLRTDNNVPKIKDFVPLAGLEDLVFGGWDPFDEDCYLSAKRSGVLVKDLLEQLRPTLEAIRPWPAVFDRKYVKKLDGKHVKKGESWMELANAPSRPKA
jgi:myo-inositol-1-phosphate synthase